MVYVHMLLALALNAIPIHGVLTWDWSVSTVLVLFWLENMVGTLLACVRIVLHRVVTRSPEHFNVPISLNGKVARITYLADFAPAAITVTLGHAVFVAVFAFLIVPDRFDESWYFSLDQFLQGAQLMLAVLLIDLLVDVLALRRRSFAWLRHTADRKYQRVLVLHFGIILGFAATAAVNSPIGLLCALMGTKALFDMVGVRAASAADRGAAVAPQPASPVPSGAAAPAE